LQVRDSSALLTIDRLGRLAALMPEVEAPAKWGFVVMSPEGSFACR
jgi:hypothetical protein